MTDHLPAVCCGEHAAMAALPIIRKNGDARVAAERERIANLFPRFVQGEMFDETPESDLDLDATAFAMGERFRALIGAYPYTAKEAGE